MALITQYDFFELEKHRNKVHDKVGATFTSFRIENGEKYFQIDTYGTKEREIPNKISQSIQFDKDSAKVLLNLLKKEFNL